MNSFSKFFKFGFVFIAIISLALVAGCKDDDDDPDPVQPTASFQYEISTDNFLMVTFTNFSQNATSYSWAFGDGNTSTDEDPVHVYSAAGDYTVELTATNDEGSKTKSETFTLTDPNSALTLLAGTTSKTWYLQREGVALGIGPAIGDNSWWGFGAGTPLGDRPCILDDKYTFHADGTWEFDSGGTLFVDANGNGGWLGDTESCYDETEPGVWTTPDGDNSDFASGGAYTFEYDAATSLISILGSGAYIGLAQKTNSTTDNYLPINLKEYTVFNFVAGDIADSLQMALLREDNSAWNFYLVSYHDINDLPDIPTSLPGAGFAYVKDGTTVTFSNNSTNSTSYSWDFGDGNTSTEEDPIHIYGGAGDYDVTLTAMDDNGNSDQETQTITISLAVFTVDILSNETGRVWKLQNAPGSYKVGPAAGDGSWWSIPEEDLATRACAFDDEFIFANDGTYTYDSKGMLWAEAYMLADGCVADGDLTPPFDVLGSGTHTFEAFDAVGGDPAKIRVIGTGAFVGFSKAFNGGELNGAADPPINPVDEITYDVFDYVPGVDKDVLVITVDISADGSGWWTMTLESEN